MPGRSCELVSINWPLMVKIRLSVGCRLMREDSMPVAVMTCKWIEANHSMPPVVFKELLDATVDDENVKDKIKKMIRFKREGKECDMLLSMSRWCNTHAYGQIITMSG